MLAERSEVSPKSSATRGTRATIGPPRFQASSRAGLPSHHPSRTLKTVSNRVSAGVDRKPMLGLAAAPEMAIAVPSVNRSTSWVLRNEISGRSSPLSAGSAKPL